MERCALPTPKLKFKILWYSCDAEGLLGILGAVALTSMVLGFAYLTGFSWGGFAYLAAAITR
jgi:hypothetical protein